MKDKPSDRVIDQRIRNRIMETLLSLAEGDEGVREQGATEYFESFYDWIPHRDHGTMRPNSAITAAEQSALLKVSSVLDDACDATPRNLNDDEFISTGWPAQIQPVAQEALALMRTRGRFGEEWEEDEPSFSTEN